MHELNVASVERHRRSTTSIVLDGYRDMDPQTLDHHIRQAERMRARFLYHLMRRSGLKLSRLGRSIFVWGSRRRRMLRALANT